MKIGIIGGGASGMFLASMLNGYDVTLFEKNSKLGKKLLITGNGRCNFTSNDFSDLSKIYNNEFASCIYKKYDNNDMINYLISIGVEPKLEIHREIGYYYPNSNKSNSVYYCLLDKITNNNVNVLNNINITSIFKINDKFILNDQSNKKYDFDILVLSTGGNSYQNTGSTGDGYNFAKKLGHSIIDIKPGLTSLQIKNENLKDFVGVRVDGIVKFKNDNIDFIEKGELQFNKNSISGIPILNLSRYINRNLSNKSLNISIDFYTNYKGNYEDKFNYLFELLKQRKNNICYKRINDFLCGFLPDEIGNYILKKSNVLNINISDLSSKNLETICENIINFNIEVSQSNNFDFAQITLGGINTSEIDNNTLESKIIKNLFFTGEVMDIDGKCGGYNLQLCYSTAKIVFKRLGELYGKQL